MNKYRAIRTQIDGITFDSKAEARRYGQLRALEKARKIYSLECHRPFDLIVNGVKVATYVADFVYFDDRHQRRIEDVKNPITAKKPEFVIKAKLMRAVHGLEVEIVS